MILSFKYKQLVYLCLKYNSTLIKHPKHTPQKEKVAIINITIINFYNRYLANKSAGKEVTIFLKLSRTLPSVSVK